nr:GDSL-like lipase/acylhydrolase U56931 [Ganoderma boninense]
MLPGLSPLRAVSAGVALLLASSAATAAPHFARESNASYSAIVAFGDSFTDNGNGAWALSNHTWPANPNYFDGRFSNGPVWIEYVAGNLSVPLVDFAVGGATSSNELVQGYTGPNSTIPVPSVDEQVTSFLQPGSVPSNLSLAAPLFVLMGGANDPLFNISISANESFRALIASTARLAAAHPAAHFLFLDYPDLARIPMDAYVSNATTKDALHTYSTDLAALFRGAFPAGTPGATFVDVMPLFAEWEYYGAPAAFGFAPLGAYGSCLTGAYGETSSVTLCADADEVVFWDEYHPTTHAHSWIAKLVLAELQQ